MNDSLSRRRFFGVAAAGAASLALSACTSVPRRDTVSAFAPDTRAARLPLTSYSAEYYREVYGPVADGGFEIPPVPFERLDPRLLRQRVVDPTGEAPGTIIVDTGNHYLYLVEAGGTAMRYGVGLGRAGFEWSGRGEIEWKQPWPRWFPPQEMIDREPELRPYTAEYNSAV